MLDGLMQDLRVRQVLLTVSAATFAQSVVLAFV